MTGSTKISIDGKTYGSPEEMPPDVRKIYEAMVGRLKQLPLDPGRAVKHEYSPGPGIQVTRVDYEPVTTRRIVVNGKEYAHMEDLPPEARAALEQARGVLASSRPGSTQTHNITVQRMDTKITGDSAGDESSSGGILGWIAALIALLMALAVVLWRHVL